MQIHEVTKKPLAEGIFDAFQSPDKMAAQAAEKLRAQGYGQPRPELTPQQAMDGVQQNTAQQQYIMGLVAQWQKDAPKVEPTPAKPTVGTATTPGVKDKKSAAGPTKAATPQKSSLPSITVGGKLLTKGPDGLWHGEDGRAVQDPAQAAKIDKAYRDQEYRRKQFQQTAMVREAPEEYTTPGGIVVPKGSTTDQKAATPEPSAYRSNFETWAAKKILTKEPVTRQTITLDAVKSSAIGNDLEQALSQVVATAGDTQKNAEAVKKYLTLAVAGVVMKTQELRSKTTGAGDSGGGQGIVTQQELRNRLSQEVGLNSTQLNNLVKIGQDPSVRRAIMKLFGV